jgi:hypothetical protein
MSPPIDGRPAEIVRKLKHYLREVPNINSLLAQLRPPIAVGTSKIKTRNGRILTLPVSGLLRDDGRADCCC